MPWTAAYCRRQDFSSVLRFRALGRAATAVSRVRVVVFVVVRCVVARSGCVDNAGISNVDGPLGDAVVSCSVSGASVDSVLVIETTALRVNFNHLVTHGD